MEISEKMEFMHLLTNTYASYAKPLPERSIIDAWWSNLSPYPMGIVRAALQGYSDQNGDFEPKPAGIAMRCRLMDGRPDAEEAWAVALSGRSETDTVMWTQETAEAFAIARLVIDVSGRDGAVSGRRPFLAAYERLVNEARAARRPIKYLMSLGWDIGKRAAVIAKARTEGALPAPDLSALLPAPIGEPLPNAAARAQMDSIRKMLALTAEEKRVEAECGLEADWREGQEAKRKIAAAVARYQANNETPTKRIDTGLK